MPWMENRTELLAAAIAVCLAAAAVYLFLNRRIWLGQHLPLPLHPSRPRPGTVPTMARGLRTRPP
jgi:uncharacterized membrane protein YfcA